jgi:MFS family permease
MEDNMVDVGEDCNAHHVAHALTQNVCSGTVIGQLLFGWLADVVGRQKMYGLELVIIIFATLALSLTSDSVSMSVVGLLIFWRVLMGIGIGGGYPLSSIITSEYTPLFPPLFHILIIPGLQQRSGTVP